jgi:hypothetical protein
VEGTPVGDPIPCGTLQTLRALNLWLAIPQPAELPLGHIACCQAGLRALSQGTSDD